MVKKHLTVVISGGSAGLVKAIGLEAAKNGATVVFLARRRDKLRQAQAEATALSGHPAYAFPVDVGDPVAIEAAVDQIHETVGSVDVLVNAAGFGHFENAFDTDMRLVERMFRVNVLGVMYLTKLLGRDMAIRGQGQIINVASMAGKMATPKSAIYSATKSAVIGYSNGLRLELKPFGVHVTTVNPGPIATDFFKAAGALDYLATVSWLALDPDQLARRIVGTFDHPVREINAPRVMNLGAKLYTLFPGIGDWLAGGMLNKK